MLVTVWRHGEAGSAARDVDRTLTEHGVSHVTATAELFKNWCHRRGVIAPSICTHSPLVRTRQTAALLHDALSFSTTNECEKLAPVTQITFRGFFSSRTVTTSWLSVISPTFLTSSMCGVTHWRTQAFTPVALRPCRSPWRLVAAPSFCTVSPLGIISER